MKISGHGVLASNIEFQVKRNNRYVKQIKKKKIIKVNTLYTVVVISILLTIGALVYFCGLFILNWEKLDINSYKLFNVPHREYSMVKKILSEFRGNILAVDLDQLKEKLHTIRTIEDVAIQRSLPSVLIIKFFLRSPAYQCYYKGEYLVLSKEGIVLNEMRNENPDLIRVKDITKWKKEVLETFYQELEGIKSKIDYVDLHDFYGLTVKLKKQKETIYPGESNISDKLIFYLKIKPKLNVDISKIKYVDLRIKDRIYLEFEKEESTNEKKQLYSSN